MGILFSDPASHGDNHQKTMIYYSDDEQYIGIFSGPFFA
jgi:hypothetical protein